MTNPVQTMRMLITYLLCIPLAIFLGFMMTEITDRPGDYSNWILICTVMGLVASPIIIKWHYPILLFGVSCPIYCFFFPGNPPLWEVVTILSLGISIIERTVSSERRFIKSPVMVWPLFYTLAVALFTAEMTGGIGLHALGSDVGGGKKYLILFLGIGMYFALTSRKIAREKRNLYIALFFLATLPSFISDLFPLLPSPLNYINLLFPSSAPTGSEDFAIGTTRLGAFSTTAFALASYQLVKVGLRGLLSLQYPIRFFIFWTMMPLALLGGFRTMAITLIAVCALLFFLEGLHHTRLLLVALIGGLILSAVVVTVSDKLPKTIQRSLSFLPVKIDPLIKMDAEGSKEWRENIWRDVWPQVPQYLLIGKGYALSAEDFNYMGGGAFAGEGVSLDASQEGLAISMDYHNGPLSTLMPFGIWGAISYLWVAGAVLFTVFRNYRYGDEDLKYVNRFILVMVIWKIFEFFAIFGAYTDDVSSLVKYAGFSIALNWGIKRAPAKTLTNPVLQPMATRFKKPQIQPA